MLKVAPRMAVLCFGRRVLIAAVGQPEFFVPRGGINSDEN
jgi:hypothetical protein